MYLFQGMIVDDSLIIKGFTNSASGTRNMNSEFDLHLNKIPLSSERTKLFTE